MIETSGIKIKPGARDRKGGLATTTMMEGQITKEMLPVINRSVSGVHVCPRSPQATHD